MNSVKIKKKKSRSSLPLSHWISVTNSCKFCLYPCLLWHGNLVSLKDRGLLLWLHSWFLRKAQNSLAVNFTSLRHMVKDAQLISGLTARVHLNNSFKFPLLALSRWVNSLHVDLGIYVTTKAQTANKKVLFSHHVLSCHRLYTHVEGNQRISSPDFSHPKSHFHQNSPESTTEQLFLLNSHIYNII